jgi:hypothetical protein
MTIPNLNAETKFWIDFDWWERRDRDFRLHLHELLCADCRDIYPEHEETEDIDWIDPHTAEVKRVDALWQSIRACCSQKPGYIAPTMPLTISILRGLVANDNAPLSAEELYERIGKGSPQTILRILTGERIYYGIVPLSTPREEESEGDSG